MGALTADWFFRARLKLRHLYLFVVIGEQGNLHKSAELMGISQPAASRLLAEIETRLGQSLFERHGRGLTPNPFGQLMIRRARAVLDELGDAGEEFNAISAGLLGVVNIGAVMEPAVTLVPQTIEQVHKDRPGLKITVHVADSRALVNGLMDGHFDFIIARIPAGFPGDAFVFEEIGEEDLCFICSDSHPMGERNPPELTDLADYPWTLQPPGTLMRQRIEDLFRHRGVDFPRWVVDTSDLPASLALVDRSEFITVATHKVAALLCDTARFRILNARNKLSVQPYGLVSLRRQRLSPAVASVMEEIRRRM
ncbi:LysR family transcriptional regulator [Larsenimonas rhizosphaerae]|uniref:LysR family transcriptional regulator n=1 Tax=Larsenimonas rhizosphaerae TaxID=2944682 RepID=A0AA42CUR5_9GAMM|nr:LysR family transcriptional regulator [Larsenimonas rhizosphaerae]MCM2129598.1 LysR family transcriptional regulator [Larsenimonas rhizosphaerae]MCX2524256.1 LysR family transcriptional regulator [Larsenimonas rhizosphaerae]